MAIYLEFEKVGETAEEVLDRFGGAADPGEQLVAVPTTDLSRWTMPDDVAPALTGQVIDRVAQLARSAETWPDRGLVQS